MVEIRTDCDLQKQLIKHTSIHIDETMTITITEQTRAIGIPGSGNETVIVSSLLEKWILQVIASQNLLEALKKGGNQAVSMAGTMKLSFTAGCSDWLERVTNSAHGPCQHLRLNMGSIILNLPCVWVFFLSMHARILFFDSNDFMIAWLVDWLVSRIESM